MRRGVVSYTPQARLDLIDAALFIAEGNPLAADRFHEAVKKTISLLAQQRMLGRARPELGEELRSLPIRHLLPTDSPRR
jgi:plasmid stabilization system protein ParE